VVENFIKANKLSEVKICLIKNDDAKGKSNALNKIFSVSSGELFCVVDDDVVLEEKCLINLIGELITQKNLRCVFFHRGKDDLLKVEIHGNCFGIGF